MSPADLESAIVRSLDSLLDSLQPEPMGDDRFRVHSEANRFGRVFGGQMIAQAMRVPFQFGGTSLMITVGVALETVNQIEAHLITQSYEGLTGPRPTRLSGRRPVGGTT